MLNRGCVPLCLGLFVCGSVCVSFRFQHPCTYLSTSACYMWVCERHRSLGFGGCLQCALSPTVGVVCGWPVFVSWTLGKCYWYFSAHRKTLPQSGQSSSSLKNTQPLYFARAKSFPGTGFSEIRLRKILLLSGLDSRKLK